MSVEVAGARVLLRFQLTEATEDDVADMDDIVSELEGLVGPDVHVDRIHEVQPEREIIVPSKGVIWIFLARV